MATYPSPLTGRHRCAVIALALLVTVTTTSSVLAQARHTPQRIVTVIPAVTEILFALGAGPQLVGIGSFDEPPVGSGDIVRVGGLLDPDTERILTLRPDLVILYASQTDPRQQLERAGIPVLSYAHAGLTDIPDTIRELGERTGHQEAGERVAEELEAGLEVIRQRVAGRERPRTLLVFSREPHGLRNIYASGGVGFIHDLLEVAGGDNVFAQVDGERVAQVSSEAILSAAPEVIIELRNTSMFEDASLDGERAVWRHLAAVPAVRTDRVHFLTGNEFVVPGPRVVQAADQLARVLHPAAFQD